MSSIDIGAVEDFPIEEGVYIGHEVTGGEPIAVFRTDDGIYALQDRCTHGNYSLSEGWAEDGAVECPKHASSFCLANGKVLNLPATADAATHQAETVAGRVLLTADIDGKAGQRWSFA